MINIPVFLMCLTQAIYFEAQGEPFIGRIAVASVIMNRVQDPRFPDDICEVVYQGPTYKTRPDVPIRHRCQFSFYCDGKSDEVDFDTKPAQEALQVALMIADGRVFDVTEGSTFYHAVYVNPGWAKTKTRVVQIQNHIFYRWENLNKKEPEEKTEDELKT
jgi:spore germination cell wall hydrolase CwlJ-like protein